MTGPFHISPLASHVNAADLPPERLAGNSTLTEEQKIHEASRQFEAILLRQVLAESQKPVITSKYTDNSTSAGIYRDMVTNQMAESISKSGALGLAQTFEHQLTHQSKPHPEAGTGAAASPTLRGKAQPGRPPHLTHAHVVRTHRAHPTADS